ncbi:MAG: hypothetical protein QM703_26100 [Gemmatales bacterium]
MTKLLEQAFAKAAKLPEAEQEVLASRLLTELEDETAFDAAIAQSGDKLAQLAEAALKEHRAGKTKILDPDQL